MRLHQSRTLAAAALVALCGLSAAEARDLRVASASPPTHPSYDPAYVTFIAKLEELSGGALTATHYGMEVVNLRGSVSALESGVVDIANILQPYFPADFPNSMLLADLAPLGEVGSGIAAATVEYLATCGDCQSEFSDKGLVYLTSVSTPSYDILTGDKPVRTIEDLQGMRLRSPGAAFSIWIKEMGAIPAEISFNDEYEAMQSGLIDGTIAPPVNLVGNRLSEVTKYYTPVGVGTFNTSSTFTVRKDTWAELSEEERGFLVRAALAGSVRFEPRSREAGAEGLEELVASGGEILEPSEALIERTRELQAAAIDAAIENGNTVYSIADAETKARRFAELVKKWNAIMEPIQDDPDAMAQALYDEVWSKIDLSTYGL